jgi:hypothetical protein
MEALPQRAFCQPNAPAARFRARIIPAIYVKLFNKGQKNDYNDEEAIAEAVLRPNLKTAAWASAGAVSQIGDGASGRQTFTKADGKSRPSQIWAQDFLAALLADLLDSVPACRYHSAHEKRA